MASKELVLVTGGSGFVGAHCILALLRAGYRVRTTVRDLAKADCVRSMLQEGAVSRDQANSVDFVEADLLQDKGWPEACKDCIFVLHVASPLIPGAPKHEDDLIVPVREGTLRALRAAKAAGTVRRVVVTSAFAAIGYGHEQREEPFTESDWTDLDNPKVPVPAYQKSKTIAERAAWEWIEKEGDGMELTVLNPGGIFGPVLGKDFAASVQILSRLLNGELPGLINFGFRVVDVRDVADLHVLAMTHPKAKGERFLACSDEDLLWMKDIADILKRRLDEKAKKVPSRTLPNLLVKAIGVFNPDVGMVTGELGVVKHTSGDKAKYTLGWKPKSAEEAIISCARSLGRFGLIKS